jgi:hypothetical protein
MASSQPNPKERIQQEIDKFVDEQSTLTLGKLNELGTKIQNTLSCYNTLVRRLIEEQTQATSKAAAAAAAAAAAPRAPPAPQASPFPQSAPPFATPLAPVVPILSTQKPPTQQANPNPVFTFSGSSTTPTTGSTVFDVPKTNPFAAPAGSSSFFQQQLQPQVFGPQQPQTPAVPSIFQQQPQAQVFGPQQPQTSAVPSIFPQQPQVQPFVQPQPPFVQPQPPFVQPQPPFVQPQQQLQPQPQPLPFPSFLQPPVQPPVQQPSSTTVLPPPPSATAVGSSPIPP